MNALIRLAPQPVWSFRPDGSVRDLAAPDPMEIDFFAMANALSKIARFNGSNPGIAYSVAQHSVMGADAIFNETGDTRMAAWFLLHDGEEYLLGDKVTPAQRLLEEHAEQAGGSGRGSGVRWHWTWIKRQWREAGWQAAALGLPDSSQQAHIDDYDRRMCNAEMLALFGPTARAQLLLTAKREPLRLKGGIRPWAPMKAEERFREAACRFIGEDRLHEQAAIHADHVELTRPHGPHAGEPAGPAAARQTIADGRSALRPPGDNSTSPTRKADLDEWDLATGGRHRVSARKRNP